MSTLPPTTMATCATRGVMLSTRSLSAARVSGPGRRRLRQVDDVGEPIPVCTMVSSRSNIRVTENGDCTGISRMSSTRSPISDTLASIASRSSRVDSGPYGRCGQFHVGSVRAHPIGRTTVPHQRPFVPCHGMPWAVAGPLTFAAHFSKRHDRDGECQSGGTTRARFWAPPSRSALRRASPWRTALRRASRRKPQRCSSATR